MRGQINAWRRWSGLEKGYWTEHVKYVFDQGTGRMKGSQVEREMNLI